MLAEGRKTMWHGRGPCSEINQRKSNRKSNKSMEIKVIFSKFSYGKPYSEPKNPQKFPLASLATHEEEFSAQNARFFRPKTPRTRFVLHVQLYKNHAKWDKMNHDFQKFPPAARLATRALKLKKKWARIKILEIKLWFFFMPASAGLLTRFLLP